MVCCLFVSIQDSIHLPDCCKYTVVSRLVYFSSVFFLFLAADWRFRIFTYFVLLPTSVCPCTRSVDLSLDYVACLREREGVRDP